MSAIREAVAAVEEKIDAECQDAPAPCFEENDYEAGFIAGLAFAQDLLRELLKAHPDAAPEYEWATQYPTEPQPIRAISEESAREMAGMTEGVALLRRTAAGAWESAA